MPLAESVSAIFRAYDIRGIVGQGLDEAIIHQIGQAVATEVLERGEDSLCVGADARLSSPGFRQAMIAGVLSTGCHVIDLGTVTSPMLYFATHTLPACSGVMITGSHNPGHYNGVKLVIDRRCLADTQIQALRERIEAGQFRQGQGRCQHHDIRPAYETRLRQDLTLRPGLHVVIDAGNGVGGLHAPDILRALGCRVTTLFCEPDGHFPHHHPDPTIADNLQDLQATVIARGADLGIALDGDGDRVGLVTASGHIINADSMMMCFIRDILPENPGATVVFDVKSSFHLPVLIESLGGVPLMCKSGHSYVKKALEASGALLGGEYSAHLFFRHRWFGFDDGFYAGLRFLELMSRGHCSADQLVTDLPQSVSTPELAIAVADNEKFPLMTELAAALDLPGAQLNRLDGVRADYPDGWGLLRASNTTPSLVCRFEAQSAESLERIQGAFREQLQQLAPRLTLPF